MGIGIDLGASKIAAALVRADGRVLASRQVATRAGLGPEAVLGSIAGLADELASVGGEAVQGIGIGAPGQVDPSGGTVRGAVNLGWQEVRLAAGVRARLARDRPVWVQKDANASALGEWFYGAARGCGHFVYVSVGSGLGAGVVANGLLVTGADHYAADLGHLCLDPQGLPCTCGRRGCTETVVSGPGLVNLVRGWQAGGRPTSLPASGELLPGEILAAARAGDGLARAALGELGRQLGVVLAACVSLLNPALLVLGGGLGLAAFDWIAPAARQEVALRTLPASHRGVKIVPSELASSAVGAACLVWYDRNSNRGGDAFRGLERFNRKKIEIPPKP